MNILHSTGSSSASSLDALNYTSKEGHSSAVPACAGVHQLVALLLRCHLGQVLAQRPDRRAVAMPYALLSQSC
jgi:hypothetical protein